MDYLSKWRVREEWKDIVDERRSSVPCSMFVSQLLQFLLYSKNVINRSRLIFAISMCVYVNVIEILIHSLAWI